MTTWFTSDEHYGHANIIKYCSRPFENVHEMNEALIEAHNARVGTDDIVYHLGDFALHNQPEKFLSRLNGHHNIIIGNHDRRARLEKAGFTLITNKILYSPPNSTVWFLLAHHPTRLWEARMHSAILLHGHTHATKKDTIYTIDVGVDAWKYAPVSLEEVIAHSQHLWEEQATIEDLANDK